MVSVTISVEEKDFAELKRLNWINWSKIGCDEARKKEIFERYLKTKKLDDEDWIFCDKMDWHPVDELPLKASYIKELKKREKEQGKEYLSVEDFINEL